MAHKWRSSGICAWMSALFWGENPANRTFSSSHTLSVCSQSLDVNWTFIVFLSDRKARGTMDRSLCSGMRSRRSWRGRSISWWGQVRCLSSRGHTLRWNAGRSICAVLWSCLVLMMAHAGNGCDSGGISCQCWPLGAQGLFSGAKPFLCFLWKCYFCRCLLAGCVFKRGRECEHAFALPLPAKVSGSKTSRVPQQMNHFLLHCWKTNDVFYGCKTWPLFNFHCISVWTFINTQNCKKKKKKKKNIRSTYKNILRTNGMQHINS